VADTVGSESGSHNLLYHYSETPVATPIGARAFWTNFKSSNPRHASIFTHTDFKRLKYRTEVKVNRDVIDGADPWFTNDATTVNNEFGDHFEYTNRKDIGVNYMTTVKMDEPE